MSELAHGDRDRSGRDPSGPRLHGLVGLHGARLRAWRRRSGLSLDDVERLTGGEIGSAHLEEIESGRELASLPDSFNLASIYGAPPFELLDVVQMTSLHQATSSYPPEPRPSVADIETIGISLDRLAGKRESRWQALRRVLAEANGHLLGQRGGTVALRVQDAWIASAILGISEEAVVETLLDADVVTVALGRWDRAPISPETIDRAGGDTAAPQPRGRSVAHVAQSVLRHTHLHQSIEQGDLTCVFQPVVDLMTGEIVGAEALARCSDSRFSSLEPAELIAAVKSAELLDELAARVLEEACREAASWPTGASGPRFVSVNIAASQLPTPVLAGAVVRALAMSELPTDQLVLELTESDVIADEVAARSMLEDFQHGGIRLFLDDLGSGYSSLLRLVHLPFDGVKIDQALVRDMAASERALAVVEGLDAIANALGLTVIAEGVEDDLLLERLRRSGIGLGQGYYFSEPLEPAAFRALLSDWENRPSVIAMREASATSKPSGRRRFLRLRRPQSKTGSDER